VICVDNLETGLAREHPPPQERVELPLRDVRHHRATTRSTSPSTSSTTWPRRPRPIDYARLPLHTLKVGAYGTHNTLGLAKKHRARFLLASTSEVYGDPLVHPQPETYWGNVNPIGPRGVYDEAKRYAEALTMAYFRQQGVGHRDRPDLQHVRPAHAARTTAAPSPAFLGPGARRPPVTVFGDGSQTRSFCLRRRPDPRPRAARGVGGPRAGEHRQPGRDVAARDGEADHRADRVALRRSSSRRCPVDDPQVRQPDIARARDLLDWEPEIDVRDGIARTIEHYTKLLGQTGAQRELARGQEPRGHLEAIDEATTPRAVAGRSRWS
jgi:dTDP-glucose 4,6-dehydratase